MDITAYLVFGKIAMQTVAITKTCFSVYKHADRVYFWWNGKDHLFSKGKKGSDEKCIIIDTIQSENTDDFVVINIEKPLQDQRKSKPSYIKRKLKWII